MGVGRRRGAGQMTGFLSCLLEQKRNAQLASRIPDGSMVLDVGCGRAVLFDMLRRQGKTRTRYVGIDIDADCIDGNRARWPSARFETADAREPGDRVGRGYDIVALGAVIEHFEDPAGLLRVYRSCLRPGGRFVLTTPMRGVEDILALGSRLGLLSREARRQHRDVLLDPLDLERIAHVLDMRMVFYRRFLFGMNQLAVFALRDGLDCEARPAAAPVSPIRAGVSTAAENRP